MIGLVKPLDDAAVDTRDPFTADTEDEIAKAHAVHVNALRQDGPSLNHVDLMAFHLAWLAGERRSWDALDREERAAYRATCWQAVSDTRAEQGRQ